jgi:hypothetical protein
MVTRLSRSGLLLALLALVAQLAAGGFVPGTVDLFAAQPMPICETGHGSTAPAPTAPAPHFPHLLPSPLCTALFASAFASPDAPLIPAPAVFALPRPELPPPATAPPAPWRPAAQPRAPPAFLT